MTGRSSRFFVTMVTGCSKLPSRQNAPCSTCLPSPKGTQGVGNPGDADSGALELLRKRSVDVDIIYSAPWKIDWSLGEELE